MIVSDLVTSGYLGVIGFFQSHLKAVLLREGPFAIVVLLHGLTFCSCLRLLNFADYLSIFRFRHGSFRPGLGILPVGRKRDHDQGYGKQRCQTFHGHAGIYFIHSLSLR